MTAITGSTAMAQVLQAIATATANKQTIFRLMFNSKQAIMNALG
jgi:hypothetical protein